MSDVVPGARVAYSVNVGPRTFAGPTVNLVINVVRLSALEWTSIIRDPKAVSRLEMPTVASPNGTILSEKV